MIGWARNMAVALLLSGSAACAMAYGYLGAQLDGYDPASGLYFKSVTGGAVKDGGVFSMGSKSGKGYAGMSNIFVFDPATGQGRYVFPADEKRQIVAVVFETEVSEGKVSFQNDAGALKNNRGIADRPPKSSMLILVRNPESKQETFYFAQKDGSALVEGKTIGVADGWHVDVQRSQVRVVRQREQSISIDSFAWK